MTAPRRAAPAAPRCSIRQDGGWAVIAINIAAGRTENLALAAPFGN